MVRVTGGAIFCIQMVSIVLCPAILSCTGNVACLPVFWRLSTIVFYWIAVNECAVSVYLAAWLHLCFPSIVWNIFARKNGVITGKHV